MRCFSIGYPCPTDFNPADHYIYKLSREPRKEDEYEERVRSICDAYDASAFGREAKAEIENQVANRAEVFENADFDLKLLTPYRATWMQQFRALLWRSWHSVVKEPLVVQIRIIEVLV